MYLKLSLLSIVLFFLCFLLVFSYVSPRIFREAFIYHKSIWRAVAELYETASLVKLSEIDLIIFPFDLPFVDTLCFYVEGLLRYSITPKSQKLFDAVKATFNKPRRLQTETFTNQDVYKSRRLQIKSLQRSSAFLIHSNMNCIILVHNCAPWEN